MKNIEKFLPLNQRLIVSENPDTFRDVIERLNNEIEMIPDYYQSTTVYAHYFFGRTDIFVLNWDRDTDILFCYVILNGDAEMSELGDMSLCEITGIPFFEMDFYWDKVSLAQAKYDKYPGYFSEPEDN
ncbi:MAG: hypothetical protein LBT43_19110 [Prevotella sp.]|jgi:hypothetical protein|nr:hypothetical protein [Prevotella sp.]